MMSFLIIVMASINAILAGFVIWHGFRKGEITGVFGNIGKPVDDSRLKIPSTYWKRMAGWIFYFALWIFVVLQQIMMP